MVRVIWISDFASPNTVDARVTCEVVSRLAQTPSVEVLALNCGSDDTASSISPLPCVHDWLGPPSKGHDKLRKTAHTFSPDVVVTLGNATQLAPRLETKEGRSVPWIASMPVTGLSLAPTWRKLRGGMAACVAFSEFGCKGLRGHGIEARRIPLGVDSKVFHRSADRTAVRMTNRLADRFVVGCILNDPPEEQLSALLKAFAIFVARSSEASLCLHTGNSNDDASIRDQLARHALADHAVVLNHQNPELSDAERSRLYHLFDLSLVLATGEESQLMTLESLACGVPVIAADDSAAAELLQEGLGELVRVQRPFPGPRDESPSIPEVDHLAEIFAKLYRKPGIRAEYRRRGIQFAHTMTWERCVTEWLLLIGEAIGRREHLSPKTKLGERILIHREIGLGDVLMSFIAARAFKEANPQNHVTFATAPKFVEFVRHCPMVDEVVTPGEVRHGRFTRQFDFDGKESFDFAPGWRYRERIDIILDFTGLPVSDKKPCYRVAPDERVAAQSLLASRGCQPEDELIGVVLSAAASPRSLTAKTTEGLIRGLLQDRPRARVVLLDNNSAVSSQLRFSPEEEERVLHLEGQLSLVELAAVVEQLHLLISPDTGTLHLAAALNVPVIAFFNEVHPQTRIGYYDNVIPKAKSELCPDWPCGEPGTCAINICCLNEITYADIKGDVDWLLARSGDHYDQELRLPVMQSPPPSPQPGWHRSFPVSRRGIERRIDAKALLPVAPEARILVMQRTGGLRDLFCALSVAQAIKQVKPRSHLTLLTLPEHQELVPMGSGFRCVDTVITQEAKPEDHDFTIDLDEVPPGVSGEREVWMGNLAGVQVERLIDPPELPPSAMQSAHRWLSCRDRFQQVIGFAPFAGGRVEPRSWTAKQTLEFLERTDPGDLIVLLDEQIFEAPERDNLLNLSGRTTLFEVLAVIAECDLFLGADSALLQMATICRIPTVGLFTHTRAMDRLGLAESLIAVQASLPCAPCGELLKVEFDCPYQRFSSRIKLQLCHGTEPELYPTRTVDKAGALSYACQETISPGIVIEQLRRLSKEQPRSKIPPDTSGRSGREVINVDPGGRQCKWDLATMESPKRLRDLTSVIIVNQNQWEACTRECVQRVIQYTIPPCEVILVDDGSGAEEVGKIKAELPDKVKLIVNSTSEGTPVSYNRGLEVMSPEARLICFLHSNCIIYEPGWNAKVLWRFNENWRLGGVCLTKGERRFFLDATTGEDYFYDPVGEELDCEMINGSCLVIDRQKTSVGPDPPTCRGDLRFDESFSPGGREDDDLSFQIRSQGWSVEQLTDYNIFLLAHGKPASASPELLIRNRSRLMEKWRHKLHPRMDYEQDCRFVRKFYRPKVGSSFSRYKTTGKPDSCL